MRKNDEGNYAASKGSSRISAAVFPLRSIMYYITGITISMRNEIFIMAFLAMFSATLVLNILYALLCVSYGILFNSVLLLIAISVSKLF